MKRFFLPLLTLVLLASLVVYAQESDSLLIDDFENGVPLSADSYGNGLGLVPWGNTSGNIVLSARQVPVSSNLILPEQSGANTVLTVWYDISSGGWGGYTHAFTDGTDWIGRDWSSYSALSFWLYGNNTGGTVRVEIFDNRNPDTTWDTAERFYYNMTDDFSGWQRSIIPFSEFKRRTDFQPDNVLNDGFGLTEVSGYAFAFPAGVGAQNAYIDDVMILTEAGVEALAVVGEAEPTEVASTSSEALNWVLFWGDEFDGAAGEPPNSDNWTCEIGGQGWGNQEWQYYTLRTENASTDGEGNLAITAREENPGDYNCWYGECTHTSARCITMDKVEFSYGRVEARLKLPYGQGIWPAFWMLGANFRSAGWPGSGEIDIMENIGREPRTVHGTVHGPGYSGGSGITGGLTLDEDLSDDFHVFAIEWLPEEIRWYIDSTLYHTVTPEDVGAREWVFDHDFFLLLNVAVGGVWPGYPDETTEFPQTMLVDYVRVYQLEE
jgi:beta-glucanase (GH16 family)